MTPVSVRLVYTNEATLVDDWIHYMCNHINPQELKQNMVQKKKKKKKKNQYHGAGHGGAAVLLPGFSKTR